MTGKTGATGHGLVRAVEHKPSTLGSLHTGALATQSPTARPLAAREASSYELQWVRPGENIMGQLMGGQALLGVSNMTDEVLDGFQAGTDGATWGNRFWCYDGRIAASLPAGSAVLVRESTADQVESTLRRLGTLGLADTVHVIRVAEPGGPSHHPLIDLALADTANISNQLSGLGVTPALFGYIGSPNMVKLATRLGLSEQATSNGPEVNVINNKAKLTHDFGELGVPIADGAWLRGQADMKEAWAVYNRLDRQYGGTPQFLRLGRASSGAGVWQVRDKDQFTAQLTKPRIQWQIRDPEIGIDLRTKIDIDLSPNIMVWVGNTRAEHRLVSVSDQILINGGTVHAGNASLDPRHYPIVLPHVAQMVDYMHAEGYRGLAGIDLGTNTAVGMSSFMEVNGRRNGNNGGGFPAIGYGKEAGWAAHNKLEIPEDVSEDHFYAHLVSKGVAFDARTGHGVFVINHVPAAKGFTQVGVRGESSAHARELLGRAAWTG